jgi:serine/threonine-protein kinase
MMRSHQHTVATRLRTEARVLTQLEHEHLVRVLDFGRTQSGRPFLVMEYLRGRTLKELVQEFGALPAAQAVALTKQILSGLAKVHAAGIIHRDLKPDNVFVCGPEGATGAQLASAGRVKILDFGIVKVVTEHDRARLGHVAPTEEGMLVGTPAYLSPEQALSQTVTPAADLYAVGGILGYLVTGEAPFRASSQLELLRAHVMEPPVPPSARVPAAAPLDALVLQALRKKPEDRFPSAAHFLRALEDLRLDAPARPALEAGADATVLLAPLTLPEGWPAQPSAPARAARGRGVAASVARSSGARPRRREVMVVALIVLLAVLVGILVAILLAGTREG